MMIMTFMITTTLIFISTDYDLGRLWLDYLRMNSKRRLTESDQKSELHYDECVSKHLATSPMGSKATEPFFKHFKQFVGWGGGRNSHTSPAPSFRPSPVHYFLPPSLCLPPFPLPLASSCIPLPPSPRPMHSPSPFPSPPTFPFPFPLAPCIRESRDHSGSR